MRSLGPSIPQEPPPSPRQFLDRVRDAVEERLRDVLDQVEGDIRAVAPDAMPMFEAARDLTLRGGKRLRPALLSAAVECIAPGAYPHAATDLGAALELFQTYLLIHDDWMDNDPVRRGAPSVHVRLARHYRDVHLGASTAILAGDMLCALTHEIVGSIEVPAPRRRAVVLAFGRMEREVILGQCLDVTRHPDVARIHDLKTGSYTVRGPLLLGAALAGASPGAVRALETFAEPLGLAFQLRDDILGAFGSEAETGKPVGGDFREGKNTLLVAHARAHLSELDRSELDAILGNRDASDADVARARALLEQSGARAHAESVVASLRDRCLSALDTPELLPQGRALLVGFTELLTQRTK
jgi:geranylgeranyl diphosphate synthase type I